MILFNIARSILVVLEAASDKAAAVRSPITYHEKLSKLENPDRQDTAGEVGTSS